MAFFVTIHDTIRRNGERHMLNGMMHSVFGRYGWAAGSYLKAMRNFERARCLEEMLDL